MLSLCGQHPVPVMKLKHAQQQVTRRTLALQELCSPSYAFGPLAGAFIRETFNLEGQTLASMAEEYVTASQIFRTRAQRIAEQFSHYSPESVRRDVYVGAIR